MEMKAGMKYETEIIVNEGMLANHHDQSDGTDMCQING